MVAFDGMTPPRPGLVDAADGKQIEVEIWARKPRWRWGVPIGADYQVPFMSHIIQKIGKK